MRGLRTAALCSVAAAVQGVAPSAIAQQAQKTITIHSKKYAFEPAEITLKKGEPVKLVLLSDDTPHGLAVPALALHLDASQGQPDEAVVAPAAAGDFPGKCSRFCGVGHRDMKFTVHVTQ